MYLSLDTKLFLTIRLYYYKIINNYDERFYKLY